MVGPLFDQLDEEPRFDRAGLAARLQKLAADRVFIGTSSWKYEGWMGQIYSRDRYVVRGRFSKQRFEAECLREYAETFPVVCGDFAFYQFPNEQFWRKLFMATPAGFQFAFKVPEQITCRVFPSHERYGPHAGKSNADFLNSEMLEEMFLRPLEPYREKTALLIFEFGTFSRSSFEDLGAFLEWLDPFLASLPAHFRYAVEVRNPEFLEPAYFDCLRARKVGHVYNAWSRMPELGYQLQIPGSETAAFLVCRALLRHGRRYADAVKQFSPYRDMQDPNPEARHSMRVLIGRAREDRKMLFLFVNNRLEGNAPLTILSVTE